MICRLELRQPIDAAKAARVCSATGTNENATEMTAAKAMKISVGSVTMDDTQRVANTTAGMVKGGLGVV